MTGRWLVVLALCGCSKSSKVDDPPNGSSSGSSQPAAIEISIVYGSEKKSWVEEQLHAFNASQSAIRAVGKPMGSGEAMTAILDGQNQPTIFSPASSAYITLLNQAWQQHHPKPVAPAGEPLVLSPLVIAMWKPMAQALGWPDKPLGWKDILDVSKDPKGWGAKGRPEWGGVKLGHTHPEYSSSGLLSVLAIAYAGAGSTRGLSAVDLAKAEPFMAGVEDAIVHYGKSTGFFADKMIERGPSYLSAAVLYENLVIESYARSPALPLVAVYPAEGTFWADHPFSVLDAPWVDAAKRDAAGKLLAFLTARPAQERALALGFRPIDASVEITVPIDAAHGVDPKQPQTLLEVPDAGALSALLGTWQKTKKPADVVVVFDKSGSMDGRPLSEAKAAAKAFLDVLDPRDQVTLIFFDAEVYPPFGPVAVGAHKAELVERIDGVSASGETAIYDATHDAYTLLAGRRKASAHRIRAAVVMTDGRDNKSSNTLASVRSELKAHAEDRAATIFTIGYGTEPDRDALQGLAGDGGGTFAQGDVDTIIGVYRDLASFF